MKTKVIDAVVGTIIVLMAALATIAFANVRRMSQVHFATIEEAPPQVRCPAPAQREQQLKWTGDGFDE